MAQSSPSATLGTVVTAAVAASGASNAPTLGGAWTQIPTSTVVQSMSQSAQNTFSNYNLSSQVYVNTQTGEVIIANSGTQLTSAGNLLADAGIAANTITSLFGISSTTALQNAANAFAAAGLAAAQQTLKNAGTSLSAVYTTGYSLGGTESQFQAAYLSTATGSNGSPLIPSGVNLVNVSLDAPGIGTASSSGNSSKYTSYDIYTQGDVIHEAGGNHLAGTVNVALPVGPTSASISTSSLSSFVSTTTNELASVVDAHSSNLIQQSVIGSSLGNIGMSNTQSLQQLGSLSSSQIQGLLNSSSSSASTVAQNSVQTVTSVVSKVASAVGSFLGGLFKSSSSSSSASTNTTTPTTSQTTAQTLSAAVSSTANTVAAQLVQASAAYAPALGSALTATLTTTQQTPLTLAGTITGSH